ncbi:MAG: DUF2807 domain-containing protein [Saprospiraceae bacterium]|nr:DUF2807 domain-containing protein [Saprospiraceae bacterium]
MQFRDLDGEIKVEIGQEWSIKVDIPENLFPLLKVEKEDGENQLLIELKDNKNNRLYVEDSKIWIQITMPEASVIRSIGNQNVEIKGIMGRYFKAELQGNGNIFCRVVLMIWKSSTTAMVIFSRVNSGLALPA